MALKYLMFCNKFKLVIIGSLLAMQPFAIPFIIAAEQYECSVSADGVWDCAPKIAVAPPLQHQMHNSVAVSAEYNHLDWMTRDKLTAAQLATTSQYCSGAYIEPTRPGMNDKTDKKNTSTVIGAKASRYEQKQQVTTLAGDVVIRQGSMQLQAQEACLYQAENRGKLNGNVQLRENGALVVGDYAEVQLDTGTAQIKNAEYVLHKSHIHGNALYAKLVDNMSIHLKDGTYTTCEQDSNDWQINGKNIILNSATGFGMAKNVMLRIKNIPILYTPYIYFPINDRRQSGVLPASFSTSSENGFTLVTPYYFNLAPNYDATLYPQYMAKRGLLMEGEFRYLTKSGEGQFGGTYINDNSDKHKTHKDYEKTRYMLKWQHESGLDLRISTVVDYTKISDPLYYQDLKSYQEGSQTQDFVNQQGTITYRGDSFQAQLNLQTYQLATFSQITPYDRLPQITFKGMLPYYLGGVNFTYEAEAVRFNRHLRSRSNFERNSSLFDKNNIAMGDKRPDDYVTGLTRVNGNRLSIAPAVEYPINWTYGFITPKLKYFYTKYNLDLDSKGKSDIITAHSNVNTANSHISDIFKNSQDRAILIASIDSGLYFDRNTNWFGKNYRQTLEPRAYYLYAPNKDQSDIPIFDTGKYSLSYSSMFRDNRFGGTDRIGDENKLSLGITSRWIEENDFERQHVSIGQALYFKDQAVQIPGNLAKQRTEMQSNILPIALEYEYNFNRDWRATADYNAESHSPQSGSALFHYQPENNPNKIINASYRYRNNQIFYNQRTGQWQSGSNYGKHGYTNFIKDYYKIQQHDFSMIWPIMPQWNLITRWQYDYARNRTLEAFGGFEYDNCCWKLRVVNRYWISNDEYSQITPFNEKSNHGLFFQIVLKGLGGLTGSKVDGFLDKGIEGYRERKNQTF
ncbi:LPS-assembly protein LptD [Candidatus Pseudomonas adelgestsugas]|uniref:LPS-assembly protein LptD n=1 Tax=Candidatus Pseudomonas adelgestsugas TaxID=1302376 RepID=A0ABX5R769_9PSED|nr:LPS-assembly protein LptD [Candidatus Pseudomonas adelgestsugas]QAX81490.1 LPS-assembly protein LptD precursor [Candidatus Pseudomonas adelgestsugas]